MSATLTNSRPERKQLAGQLDRFDAILDGLSEALNEAVADASREGVRLAVKEAVVELLTNAELKAALHQASVPDVEARPSFMNGLKQKIRQAAVRVTQATATAASAIASRVVGVGAAIARLVVRARESTRLLTAVRVLLAFGILAAGLRYKAARRLMSGVSWLKGLATSIGERLTGCVQRLRLAPVI